MVEERPQEEDAQLVIERELANKSASNEDEHTGGARLFRKQLPASPAHPSFSGLNA